MSHESVLEPPDPPQEKEKLKGNYAILIPWATVYIVLDSNGLFQLGISQPSTPKKQDG